MARKRRWGLIVLGIVIFVVVVGVGLIATVSFLAYRQFDVKTETTSNPDEEFRAVLARFEGQQPFIEMTDHRSPTIHREVGRRGTQPLSAIHVLVWEPDTERLVRFSMPFWLVRLTGGKGVSVGPSGRDGEGFVFGDVRVNITAADLEKFGPGLILNLDERGGQRVVVWSE